MLYETEQHLTRRDEIESPQLTVYPNLLEVRQLNRYQDDGKSLRPEWGERLALYHPITSEISQLGNDAWTIFDKCHQEPQTVERIAAETMLNGEEVNSIISELRSRLIVVPNGNDIHVSLRPDFTSEAEIYVETTEACNFHCFGCATGSDRYDAGNTNTMDYDTMDMILQNAAQSVSEQGFKKLSIKWAGGEALMPHSLALIRDSQPRIDKLREQYPQVDFTQVILTNGSFLTDEVVSELKEWDAHVAISLWGIGAMNDTARGMRREKDRYENIVKGIGKIHEAGIEYNINHVVTPWNAKRFGDFIRAAWDTDSKLFIGQNWNWNAGKDLIPVGIAFFRPQTREQLEYLHRQGYADMVYGLRGGFDVMRELIAKGVPIHCLGKIDYLQLFGVIPTPCGTGFNYLAAGPRGAASCHEALFSMENTLDAIKQGNTILTIANSEYKDERSKLLGPNIAFRGENPTMNQILCLHGGSGCPRIARMENEGNLGFAASTAESLYEPIIDELLSLETMRRLLPSESQC